MKYEIHVIGIRQGTLLIVLYAMTIDVCGKEYSVYMEEMIHLQRL